MGGGCFSCISCYCCVKGSVEATIRTQLAVLRRDIEAWQRLGKITEEEAHVLTEKLADL